MSQKKTPTLRFKGYSDEWEQCKLTDLRDTYDKYSFTGGPFGSDLKSSDYTEQGVRIIQLQNIGDGKFLNNYKIYTSVEKANSLSSNLIFPGEIIIAKMAHPLARAAILPNIESQYLMASDGVRLKIDSKSNDSYFILTAINSDLFRKEALNNSTGTTRKRIGLVTLGNLSVNITKKEEQVKIGAFFKNLDDTITLHQRKLKILKQLKQAMLQKMFPVKDKKVPELRFKGFLEEWEQRKLGEVANDISDGDWIEKEHIFDDGEYRIIQTGNLGEGEYLDKPNNAKYFYQKDFDEIKANEIFAGDLLISRLAEPAGRTIILPTTNHRMVTAVDVTIIRPDDSFDSTFLMTQMNSSQTLNKVGKSVSGTSHKRISRKNLEKINLLIPSLNEQKRIGSFFKQLDHTITLHQSKLSKLKSLKTAYLQLMFI